VVTPQGYGGEAGSGYCAGVEERYETELAQSSRVLDNVDRALERLSAGTYDACESCGAPIADGDLALDPTRRRCAQHAPA
jgi:DnaK suppressor protein